MLSPQHWREAVALAEEFSERPREGVKNRTQGQFLEFTGVAFMYSGDGDRAEAAFQELGEVAQQTRDASNQLQALSFKGAMAVVDGRLEDALSLGEQLVEQAHPLGMPGFTGIAMRGRGRALIYLDQVAPGEPSLSSPAVRPLFIAYMGQHREAANLLAQVLPLFRTGSGEIDGLAYSTKLEVLMEAATVLGDKEVAGLIAPLLADCPGVAGATGPSASTQRLVGAAYASMGELDQARIHYQQAIETCARMRFRPELALSRLALAELLLEHALTPTLSQGEGEREQALDHLDFAIKEFEAMKMQPSLERALALRARNP